MSHYWGEWPDQLFSQVDQAAYFIGQYCRKYGRIGVRQTKEKYGTARVYCDFGFYQLFSITHPGYAFSRYPKWLWSLDCKYFSRVISKLNWIVVPYQIWIYRRAYELAFKKWPLIKDEIISGADYPELISAYFDSIPMCSGHSADPKKVVTVTSSTLLVNSSKCLLCKEKIEISSDEEETE